MSTTLLMQTQILLQKIGWNLLNDQNR